MEPCSSRSLAGSVSFLSSERKDGVTVDEELELLPDLIRSAAEPLPPIEDAAFGAFFDRFGDARVVLLGEASHGTSEFYRARAAITKRLVERFGFNIVAVEADW